MGGEGPRQGGRRSPAQGGGGPSSHSPPSGVPSRGSVPRGATWNFYCPFAAEQGRERTEGGRQGLTHCQEHAAARGGPTEPWGRNSPCCRGASQGFAFLPEAAPSHRLAPSLLGVPRPLRAPGLRGRRGREQVDSARPAAAGQVSRAAVPEPAGTPSPSGSTHACTQGTGTGCPASRGPAGPMPAGQAAPGGGRVLRSPHPPSGGRRHRGPERGLRCPKSPRPKTNRPRTDSWVGRSPASILSPTGAWARPPPSPTFLLPLNVHTEPRSGHRSKLRVCCWTREELSPNTHAPWAPSLLEAKTEREMGLDVWQTVGQAPGPSEAGWSGVTRHSESGEEGPTAERRPPPPQSTLATSRISLSNGQSRPLNSEGDPRGLTDNDASHTLMLLF